MVGITQTMKTLSSFSKLKHRESHYIQEILEPIDQKFSILNSIMLKDQISWQDEEKYHAQNPVNHSPATNLRPIVETACPESQGAVSPSKF